MDLMVETCTPLDCILMCSLVHLDPLGDLVDRDVPDAEAEDVSGLVEGSVGRDGHQDLANLLGDRVQHSV